MVPPWVAIRLVLEFSLFGVSSAMVVQLMFRFGLWEI